MTTDDTRSMPAGTDRELAKPKYDRIDRTSPPAESQVPNALRGSRRWVCWGDEGRQGGRKVPIDPRTRRNARPNVPSTWSDLAQAIQVAQDHGWGVGRVLVEGDGLVGIDLDRCVDPPYGEIEPWAAEIVSSFDSYAEYSPSGSGIHIWVRAAYGGESGTKQDRIEVYGQGQYITLTGKVLPGSPRAVRAAQEQLDAFVTRIFAPASRHVPNLAEDARLTDVALRPYPRFSDDKLLAMALAAKNGCKVEALMAGRCVGYPSPSEADLGLCLILAFWTRNPAQIDRLFRRSKLYDAKWDKRLGGTTYGGRTIQKALLRQTKCRWWR